MMRSEDRRNIWISRLAVVILGLSALISLVMAIVLANRDRLTLEIFVALGSAAICGLAGPLATFSSHR